MVLGIGDKGEDFVEKGHQIGLRDKRHTWNIQNLKSAKGAKSSIPNAEIK
jgi:hypothetical protein